MVRRQVRVTVTGSLASQVRVTVTGSLVKFPGPAGRALAARACPGLPGFVAIIMICPLEGGEDNDDIPVFEVDETRTFNLPAVDIRPHFFWAHTIWSLLIKVLCLSSPTTCLRTDSLGLTIGNCLGQISW